jgi:hypothetical protein
MKLLVCSILILVLSSCNTQEPSCINEQRVDIFYDLAKKILEKNTTAETTTIWNAKFKQKLDQKATEKDASLQSIAIDVAIDFFSGLVSKKTLTKADKIEACRIITYYVDNGLDFPTKVKEHMTRSTYDKIEKEHLNDVPTKDL